MYDPKAQNWLDAFSDARGPAHTHEGDTHKPDNCPMCIEAAENGEAPYATSDRFMVGQTKQGHVVIEAGPMRMKMSVEDAYELADVLAQVLACALENGFGTPAFRAKMARELENFPEKPPEDSV